MLVRRRVKIIHHRYRRICYSRRVHRHGSRESWLDLLRLVEEISLIPIVKIVHCRMWHVWLHWDYDSFVFDCLLILCESFQNINWTFLRLKTWSNLSTLCVSTDQDWSWMGGKFANPKPANQSCEVAKTRPVFVHRGLSPTVAQLHASTSALDELCKVCWIKCYRKMFNTQILLFIKWLKRSRFLQVFTSLIVFKDNHRSS